MSNDEGDGRYQIDHDMASQDQIVTAVTEAMQRNQGAMVTKVMVVTEIIGPDGRRALFTACSPGMTMWDEAGLLTYCLDRVRNFELLNRLASLDKDDE